jgi:hypothetical protein
MTPQQWQQRGGQLAADQIAAEKLRLATVAYVQVGQMQPETDYNYQAGESTQPLLVNDRTGRRAATWFTVDLPVENNHPMALVVTYTNDESAKRTFDILAGDTKIGDRTENPKGAQEAITFPEAQYDIPAAAITGKNKITIKFQATNGNETGGIFGIRMVRKDMQ